VLGTPHWPWRPIDEGDARAVIEAIRRRGPRIVALATHDSTPWTFDVFAKLFGEYYRTLRGSWGAADRRRLPPPRPLPQLERGGSGAAGGEGSEPDPRAAPPWPDQFPFEQLTVPTLVISARDDALAPYRFAAEAARRIPTAKLVSVDDGSHFFMGRDVEGRAAIAEFVHELIRNVAQAPTVAFAGQSIHPMLMIRAMLTARMNRYQRLK
jgi:pimeloyl-ACP methyl ester carboxylesterase